MIQDLTAAAAEALVSAALPQDAARTHYLATQKRPHEGDFCYAEIIADPYAESVQDEEGIPSYAHLPVLVNYVSPNDEDAERFLRVVTGLAFLTPTAVADLIAQLPEPLNLLKVYWVDTAVNGIEPQTDDTVVAQFQLTLHLRPVIISQ